MSRKLIVSMLTAGAMTAAAMSAGAAEVTVEDVLAGYSAASASVSEATCAAVANGNVNLNVPDLDMSMGIDAGMILDMAMKLDPLSLSATGATNLSVMGEDMLVNIGMYMVPDGDGMAAYVDIDDNQGTETSRTVQKIAISAEDTAQLKDMIAQSSEAQMDLTALGLDFVLADETVVVNDTDCYEVTTTITADQLPALLGNVLNAAAAAAPEAMEAVGQMPSEEDLGMIASLLTGLQVNIKLDVDTETYAPKLVRIDMDGSDWGVIATLAASYLNLTNEDGSLMEVNISAEDLYLEYAYWYDGVEDVTVPQDVIDNAVETSVEDMEAMAGDMIEVAE